eukprot:XP_011681365.1 PREDICTED: coatomer subunit beta [Strongylocentrotus purpuratus]
MTSALELSCYTLINMNMDVEPPNEMQLKNDIEKGDTKTKTESLKKLIYMILNGEKFPGILMHVIRFLLPLKDHTIKKLLLIFWEIVPKTHPDGKLLQEMILVCDAYRKDLQHPNEFIRGSTLRFLCKLKEAELIEPLMPAIRACLEHRHSYVRRNAVLAIFTIYKSFDTLIPDAPELIHNFLEQEQDASSKRNAFMMLIHVDQERALDYLSTCIDQIHSFNDILQLVIVELVYKVCHTNPSERARFIRCIYNLLQSSSPAVRYEAAGTLVTLSSAPTAVKAAASCYIDLIIKESDNNVKLIVLDRLIALKDTPAHEKVLQELVMDILRVLSASDLEVRRKTLDLALDLISSRNIEEMVLVLKKEVSKTQSVGEHEDTGKYRQLLVRTLHSCSVKFPDVAATVIPLLMEFLSDTNELAAADVLVFVREAIERFEQLKPLVISKLLEVFPTIKAVKIHRAALWILGEYCTTIEDIQSLMTEVRNLLGEIPIVDDEIKKAAGEDTQDIHQRRQWIASRLYQGPCAEVILSSADIFMSECRHSLQRRGLFEKKVTSVQADDPIHFLQLLAKADTGNTEDQLTMSLTLATMGTPARKELADLSASKLSKGLFEKKVTSVQADDPIHFLQLLAKADTGNTEDQLTMSLTLATMGTPARKELADLSASKLSKVTQLTGFSDPVYAEAYININQYDIVLDVLIVNQTKDVLQNCSLELATLGDLKLVEKPQPMTLAPHDFCNIKANIKVASTENGIIFGNIVYDVSGSQSDRSVVVLNDIHIDIMDYIVPASCTDAEFRTMWAEFEWENKVTVNTNINDLREYLKHLISSTNMRCLTPEKGLSGECGFMAANLYARSIFGEDALANVSIEKPSSTEPNASVTGHVRIRAKSQGMALSMGDKINLSQKKDKNVK